MKYTILVLAVILFNGCQIEQNEDGTITITTDSNQTTTVPQEVNTTKPIVYDLNITSYIMPNINSSNKFDYRTGVNLFINKHNYSFQNNTITTDVPNVVNGKMHNRTKSITIKSYSIPKNINYGDKFDYYNYQYCKFIETPKNFYLDSYAYEDLICMDCLGFDYKHYKYYFEKNKGLAYHSARDLYYYYRVD